MESIGHAISKIRVGVTNDHLISFSNDAVAIGILKPEVANLFKVSTIPGYILVKIVLRQKAQYLQDIDTVNGLPYPKDGIRNIKPVWNDDLILSAQGYNFIGIVGECN